ncbi:MAG TPA: SDR family oxidoreductase [Chroococcales cyanobacterium]
MGNQGTGRHALIVGVTGINGHSLAEHLLANGWTVSGVSRKAPTDLPAVQHVALDITDRQSTLQGLGDVQPSHIFYATWVRRATESENCTVNGQMLRNVLDAYWQSKHKVAHVALVTGLKHYLGAFENYGKTKPQTPFREEQPRLPGENFYYTQEDVLWECAKRDGFNWSVHRPHSMIGWAIGNAMNMGVTLAVYGAICKETGMPFVFPGSPEQYVAVTDVTDARLIAKQLEWAALDPAAANQALNTVNGGVFRWERMWKVVADGLRLKSAPYPGHATVLEEAMKHADAEGVWKKIAAKHDLVISDVNQLASWWHTDADLGRTIECFTDMTKSRNLGFLEYQDTDRSFTDLFEQLRERKIIPR